MSNQDRRHSALVGQRFAAMDPDAPRELVAGALLHDVGKIECGLGTFSRVAATLVGPRGAPVHGVPRPRGDRGRDGRRRRFGNGNRRVDRRPGPCVRNAQSLRSRLIRVYRPSHAVIMLTAAVWGSSPLMVAPVW